MIVSSAAIILKQPCIYKTAGAINIELVAVTVCAAYSESFSYVYIAIGVYNYLVCVAAGVKRYFTVAAIYV